MNRINHLAVVVSTVAAFVASGIWYGAIFGEAYVALAGIDPATGMSVAQAVAQLLRELVVAYVIARVLVLTGARDWRSAVGTGLWLWLGFQAMATAGAVIHEGYPWQLYALHAGDALVKMILVCVILGAWRSRATVRTQPA